MPLHATALRRPVWLFSLDSEHFHAAPTATAGLIAWYRVYGATPQDIEFRQVHFRGRDQVGVWADLHLADLGRVADAALATGAEPVVGLSFYTWNAAEFLQLVRRIRSTCPGIAIVAGGPHVQQAESYLGIDPIDAIVLGEGEATFQELLDAPRSRWREVPGIACLDQHGAIVTSTTRARQLQLAEIPSPFDVIELSGPDGQPLYDAVSYETTRGCPYSCAFCEWGTGAIGTRMVSFPLARIRTDWEKIVRAGIANIWLADSNFGALRDDVEKARIVCELKQTYGLPRTFATSWSKKHGARSQQIVRMLHDHQLLPFYQLALQTLTPRALALCHRENMAANEYEPIARSMAAAGIPISAELIWGLPGDDLASFESNLDRLLASFPNINIFGYTLLPGTEFYRRRAEYRILTLPVAGYGKARGEYVVGCFSFDRAEGEEGYFLITAHLLLLSGQILVCTIRYLALLARLPVAPLLRAVTDALLRAFGAEFGNLDSGDRMAVYERRAEIYLLLLRDPVRCHAVIRAAVLRWLGQHDGDDLVAVVERLLDLDALLCPRYGEAGEFTSALDFDVRAVLDCLTGMTVPAPQCFDGGLRSLRLRSPGGVGVVLLSPDGGVWLRSELLAASPAISLQDMTSDATFSMDSSANAVFGV